MCVYIHREREGERERDVYAYLYLKINKQKAEVSNPDEKIMIPCLIYRPDPIFKIRNHE